jgi:hypothetical protein
MIEEIPHPHFCECDECLGLDEDGELIGWRTW